MLRELLMMMGRTAGMPLLLPDYITPLLTYTQSGNLTYFDSSGFLQTAGVDTMVLDYNPVTLALRGYPFWEARTNLLLWNRDLTNAAWVKVTMTTAKTAAGITGVANSATTITATGALSTILQTVVSGSAARATGFYIKRRTGAGTIEVTQDGVTYTDVTSLINGSTYTRVGPATATVTNPVVGIRITTSGDAVDVDCCDLQTGAFLTPTIITTTAAVTRAAPSCTITGSNFTSFYNQEQGTFVVTFYRPSVAGFYIALDATNGTTNNEVRIGTNSDGITSALIVNDGGVNQASASSTSVAFGNSIKTAAEYKINSFMVATNGVIGPEDTSGTVPTVSQLTIGSRVGGALFVNGWIPLLSYFSAALPSQLASLST